MGDRTNKMMVQAMERRSTDVRGRVFQITLLVTLLISLFILGVLLVDVVLDGWGVLTGRPGGFLSGTMRSLSEDPQLGVHQALVGTFWIAVFVAVLAFPIGIGAAIWLEEYAPKNRIARFIELNIRNLAGVPSIVYGLLGLFLFVKQLGRCHRRQVHRFSRHHPGHLGAAHRDHHRPGRPSGLSLRGSKRGLTAWGPPSGP